MISLPEHANEKRSKYIAVTGCFFVIFSYLFFQIFLTSNQCEKQMQNVRQASCDEKGLCLVTTEQGLTFMAKDVKADELVPVELCKSSI